MALVVIRPVTNEELISNTMPWIVTHSSTWTNAVELVLASDKWTVTAPLEFVDPAQSVVWQSACPWIR